MTVVFAKKISPLFSGFRRAKRKYFFKEWGQPTLHVFLRTFEYYILFLGGLQDFFTLVFA